MRVLLVYPPKRRAVQSILPREVEAARGSFPPLGILYLAGQLRDIPGLEVFALDAATGNITPEKIAETVSAEKIDLVGISILSFHLIDAIATAERIRQKSPKTIIMAGGPHPHIYPIETLRLGVFDYVALGEGEEIFKTFIQKLAEGKTGPDIPGIISRSSIVRADLSFCHIPDLDLLKFPDRKLLPIKKYFSVLSPHRPATTAISSRGCPYRCIFCDRPHLGKRFRPRSAANVVEEMESCADLGIRETIFYDDNFTTSRDRVLEIAELILKRRLEISWDIRARVGDLKPEDYRVLARAGLERIHFGVETGDPALLEFIQKKITVDEAREAFKSAREAGIETLAYFIIGLPGENEDTLNRTIALAKELKPDFVHFSLLMLFPATPVYSLALEKGIIKRDLWQEFAANPGPDFCAPIWEDKLKKQELVSALRRAYREFYFQPRYLLSRVAKTRTWQGFKNQVRMGFSILGIK